MGHDSTSTLFIQPSRRIRPRGRRGWAALPVGRLLACGLLPGVLLGGCAADVPAGAAGADLVVRSGTFVERHLLTGELKAREGERLTVPRSPNWRVQIRWMEEDGSEVRSGQKVLEFDNSNFTADLEDKRLALAESENALEKARAETVSAVVGKELVVAQRQAEVERASLPARVPADLVSRREYEERQLTLRRAEVELAKAREDLAAVRQAQDLEVEQRRIEVQKATREIRSAEAAIESLSLVAPTDGVLVVENHPWEERKLQVGDTVWVGLPVMSIPDLTAMEVEAVLSDVDEGRVRRGMEATVTPDAFPQIHLLGEVGEVAPVAREVEGGSLRRYFRVRVALEDVDPAWMRPGMSVKVEVEGPPLEDVLLAPRRCLDLASEPPKVRLPSGETREVRLGACGADACVIESGLEEGQRLAQAREPEAMGETG